MNIATYIKGDIDSPKLALVLPGLLDTKDYPHMQSHVDYLAKQGYLAVSLDAPGTWGSGDDIEAYTITNYLGAIDQLITKYGNKPTTLVGHSLGGFVASLAITRSKNIETLIAIMSPHAYVRITNQETINRWRSEGVRVSQRDLPDNADEKKTFRLPYSFVEDAGQYKALPGLAQSTIPKLFVAAKYDVAVEPALVQASYDAAAGPKEFLLFDSDHDYRRHPELIEQMNDVIGGFIKGARPAT